MITWKIRVAAIAATALVLCASATTAMASSSHSPHPAPVANPLSAGSSIKSGVHALQPFAKGGKLAPAATNTLLDSDVYISVDTDKAGQEVVAEGHLLLHNTHGSSYSGTFFDNFADKTYTASGKDVDPGSVDGKYSINTPAGKFTYDISAMGSTYKAPSSFGKNATAGIDYGAHSLHDVTGMILSVGGIKGATSLVPASGTLTFSLDSEGFVIPSSNSQGSDSKFNYTQGGKSHIDALKSWGAYSTNSNGDPVTFVLTLKLSGKSFAFSYQNSSNSNLSIGGIALSGSGSKVGYAEYSLTAPSTH